MTIHSCKTKNNYTRESNIDIEITCTTDVDKSELQCFKTFYLYCSDDTKNYKVEKLALAPNLVKVVTA